MFAALRDCVPTMKWSRHLESPQVLLESFEKEVDGYMKDKILDPLCRALEEDLRLSSHLHLQLDDRNPFKVHTCFYNYCSAVFLNDVYCTVYLEVLIS